MPQVGIFFLVHVFSALLPDPSNSEDRDFYEILGLERGATLEEIRKAYKKKSLSLHPDKVAQRREQNQEEAAAEYEKVQEAYGVLVNEEKRSRYHALQCSVKRYKFIQRGGLTNPGALLENLASSTFVDKTRLVALCSVILAILWIQPVLIASKINHVLEHRGSLEDTKWVVILLPYFLLHAVVISFWIVILFLVPSPARLPVLLTAFEQLTWFVGIIRLTRAWDGAFPEKHSYSNILTPIYIAMVLRWLQAVATLYKVRNDILRMITIDYLEREVLKGKSVEDLSEDEREEIMKSFLLVTVPPDFEPIKDEEGGDVELDEKVIEEQKVAASPEYDAATGIYNTTFGNLVSSIIFGSIFLILLSLKLDGKIDSNWWVVFTPIWVYFGSLIVYYTHSCMCGSVSGEEVVLTLRKHQQEQEDEHDGHGNHKSGDGSNSPQGEKVDLHHTDKEPLVTLGGPRQKSADNFVNPEDSARDFNRPATKEASSHDHRNVPDDEKCEDAKNHKESQSDEESSEKNGTPGVEKKKNGDEKDGEDQEEPVGLDEETFRAFQSAYAEAEENAMQEQAKASTNCCGTCFQLLILCLVVAKLDKSYESDDPDDVGFNTFWILFPLLLIFGLGCCLCACLIYGANSELSDMMDQDGAEEGKGGENGGTNGGDEEAPVTITLAPPPVDESKASATQAPSSTASNSVVDSTNLVSVTSIEQSGSNASAIGSTLVADSTMDSTSFSGSSIPLPDPASQAGSIDDLD